MPATRPRSSRVFTISFPEPLAQQVEQTAREESRNISELFREAWRAYRVQKMERRLEALGPANPPAVTQEEVETFVDKVRGEMFEGRKARLDRRS